MQVSLVSKEGLERELTIEIPAAEVDAKVQSKLQEIAQQIRLDGFRPGKVPVKVVKQRFGDSVREEVVGDIIKDAYPKALEQEKVSPAGYPHIHPTQNQAGEDLKFTATFEVYPEVKVNTLNAGVEKITATINDDDLANTIDRIREQNADWVEVERVAANGDQVTMDFIGFKDGEEFEGGKAEDYPLELGSNSMIPGFEDGLVGSKAGDEVELNLTFPEEYHAKDLAGQATMFKVTVKAVKEKKIPELDDDFFAKFDVKDGGLETLQAEIRESMERELKQKLDDINKQTVFDAWLDANDLTLPSSLVDMEIESMQREMMQRISGGRDMSNMQLPEFPRDMFEAQAKRRVSLGLLIRQYIDDKSLKADNKRVQETLEMLAKAYEKPQDVVAWYHASKERMGQIEAKVLEDQVVESLLAEAQVTDKAMSYQEAMEYQSEQQTTEEKADEE